MAFSIYFNPSHAPRVSTTSRDSPAPRVEYFLHTNRTSIYTNFLDAQLHPALRQNPMRRLWHLDPPYHLFLPLCFEASAGSTPLTQGRVPVEFLQRPVLLPPPRFRGAVQFNYSFPLTDRLFPSLELLGRGPPKKPCPALELPTGFTSPCFLSTIVTACYAYGPFFHDVSSATSKPRNNPHIGQTPHLSRPPFLPGVNFLRKNLHPRSRHFSHSIL